MQITAQKPRSSHLYSNYCCSVAREEWGLHASKIADLPEAIGKAAQESSDGQRIEESTEVYTCKQALMTLLKRSPDT